MVAAGEVSGAAGQPGGGAPAARDDLSRLGRPAARAVLWAVRRALAREPREATACLRTDLAGPDLDWQEVLAHARWHRVQHLAARGLGGLGDGEVPAPIGEALRSEHRDLRRASAAAVLDLHRVMAALRKAGARAVPFKGPAFAAAAYGGPAERPRGDLDLLVPLADLDRARAAVEELGYRLLAVPHALEPVCGDAFRRARAIHRVVREGAFELHREGRPAIELHWEAMPRSFGLGLGYGFFAPRLREAPLAGAPLPTLAPEDHLLLACAHGVKDVWGQLGRACDVAALVRAHPDLDGAALCERAARIGALRIVLAGLRVAQDLFGAAPPRGLPAGALDDPAVAAAARAAWEALDRADPRGAPPGPLPMPHPYHVLVRERRCDRLRYRLSLAIAPTTADWAAWPLRRFPLALYYLVRPLRLLGGWFAGRTRHGKG